MIALALAAASCAASSGLGALVPPASGMAPSLRVAVRGPARAEWDPISLGVGGQQVAITLVNEGRAPAAVGDVRFAFSATREGVEVPCAEHVGGAPKERAPGELAPGAAHTWRVDLDCTMPMLGRYDVRVSVSVGGAPPSDAGAFALDVAGAAGREPRAITGHDGLLAAVSGPILVPPTQSYMATVAVINRGPLVVPLGALRVVLRSKPDGKDLWCEGPPNELAAPEALGPGRMWFTRVPLACDLGANGVYAVTATLAFPAAPQLATEVGRMRVRVTDDPTAFMPP